ncbi:MAG: prepilin-type N-terminal cleavage/methylation domain-containing protein [Thermodesulfobacteriota bacterium]
MSVHRVCPPLDQRGFTLLEAMIGLAILAGVIMTVLTTLNYNLRVASYDMDLVTATILGKELGEQSSFSRSIKDGQGTFPEPYSKFSWSLHKERTKIAGLERIRIEVSWEKDRNVTFVSFIREK